MQPGECGGVWPSPVIALPTRVLTRLALVVMPPSAEGAVDSPLTPFAGTKRAAHAALFVAPNGTGVAQTGHPVVQRYANDATTG